MDPPWDVWDMQSLGLTIVDSANDWSGTSPDRFMIGGVHNDDPNMPAGPYEHTLTMLFTASHSTFAGYTQTICIDTTKIGAAGDFLFVGETTGNLIPEAWGIGERCWPIKSPPVFDEGLPTTMYVDHCGGSESVTLSANNGTPSTYHMSILNVSGGSGTAEIIDNLDGTVDLIYTTGAEKIYTPIYIDVGVAPISSPQTFGDTHTVAVMPANNPPQIECCHDFAGCEGNTYKRTITATDPDPCDTLTFALVSGPGSIDPVTGEYEFTPYIGDAGFNTVTVQVTDGYTTAECSFVIEILLCVSFEIEIAKTHDILQGHFTDIDIMLLNGAEVFAGFEFLIGYDNSALQFIEATPGEMLQTCGWEHFTYRYGADGNCGDACPSGLLRLIALAELNDGPNHPTCIFPDPPDFPLSLASLKFFITNDRTFECQYVPIKFFWGDCNDNALSSIGGDTLWLAHSVYDIEHDKIYNPGDYEQLLGWFGPPDFCLEGDKTAPMRFIHYTNGGIDIVCGDDIDARSDINCNGVANEIADAVMLTNYFVEGLGAFTDHIEASIAASDVNADGITLSVADLVYLVRVIVGDAQAYSKPVPYRQFATVMVKANHSSLEISTDSPADIGAGLFIFECDENTTGEPYLSDAASAMSIKSHYDNGILRVLVYSFDKDAKIPAGTENIFTLPITGEGNIKLTEVELSDYDGNILNTSISDQPALPTNFALHQNHPNPYNAATTISYELPQTTHLTIDIFNVLGQKIIKLYDGEQSGGLHSIEWNGRDEYGSNMASGIYIYRLTTDGFTAERKMILMK